MSIPTTSALPAVPTQTITFTLNNEPVTCTVDVRKSLLEVLREEFGLMGTKEGCGVGECGACTVMIDDHTVDSCLYLAVWTQDHNVTTIEGITNPDGTLSDIQEEYVDAGAVQCGFCIPGMIISSKSLLDEIPNPTREEIRRGLSGNMCRCTGYQKIVDAVENTATRRNLQEK